MGWAVKQKANWKGMAVATVFSLIIVASLLKWWGAVLMAVLGFILLVVSKYLCSRFGGLTGDTYGAINEFAEVVTLILMLLIGELGGASWLS